MFAGMYARCVLMHATSMINLQLQTRDAVIFEALDFGKETTLNSWCAV